MTKKRGKVMLLVILSVLSLFVIFMFIFIPPSSGKIQPFLDENGNILPNSIAEKVFVDINDFEQGMIIKGKDIQKPVLLIVHGGPGLSDYFLSTIYETGLENEFIVCYWEQRGTGLSYQKDMDKSLFNTEQFISDTIAVTNYLRTRFNQDKIFILGHSWGTYLGLMAVQREPELYEAYIAMSQIVNQKESEKEAYQYMVDVYTTENNTKMLNKLKAYHVMDDDNDLLNYRKSSLRDEAMHDLGIGTMHDMHSVVKGLFFPSLKCKDYTILERINMWRGKVFSSKTNMLFTIDDFDARIDVFELEVPIYFFAGIYDYTTSYTLQRSYYDMLSAPIKGFYTFNDSAHSPLFEEPEHAMEIFTQDILNLQVTLED